MTDIMPLAIEDKTIPISKWPEIKNDNFIQSMIIHKPKSDFLEEIEKLYKGGDRSYFRSLNENTFYIVKPNGKKEKKRLANL